MNIAQLLATLDAKAQAPKAQGPKVKLTPEQAGFAEVARRIELAASLREVPRYDATTAALIRLALAYVPPSDHLWTREAPSREKRSATNSDLAEALRRYGRQADADAASGRTGPGMAAGLRAAGIGQDYPKAQDPKVLTPSQLQKQNRQLFFPFPVPRKKG